MKLISYWITHFLFISISKQQKLAKINRKL